MSMFGGVLSSLGLEEAGEAFSSLGQVITIVGGALTALGAIVPAVVSVLSAAGITLEASFWPILVIGLAIAALVGTVVLLIASFKALKKVTPEGRLEAAKEKAEELSDAA
jgi:phage-related minor tail protein